MKTSAFLVALISLLVSGEAEAGWKTKAVVLGGGWLATNVVKGCMASPQCRAKGVEFAAVGAQKVLRQYGPIVVGKCLSEPKCANTMMAAIAMGSAVVPGLSDFKPGPGEGMEPPGDCGPGELAKLTAKVEQFCKLDRPKKCLSSDSMFELETKIEILGACLIARSTRETQCFRGGDRSHRTEIQNTKNQMNKCFERLATKQ